MLRSDHIWYDLHHLLGSPKILFGVLAVAIAFMLFFSFQYVYPFAIFFVALVAVRGLIGRRCPQCDGELKEVDAERDKESAFIMHIVWQCPRDGYTETEETKGDSGLFGVR